MNEDLDWWTNIGEKGSQACKAGSQKFKVHEQKQPEIFLAKGRLCKF